MDNLTLAFMAGFMVAMAAGGVTYLLLQFGSEGE